MRKISRLQIVIWVVMGGCLALLLIAEFSPALLPQAVRSAATAPEAEQPLEIQPTIESDSEQLSIGLATTSRNYTAEELENIDIYEERNRGVVNITTETLADNWFFEPIPQSGTTGSGSIINDRGYVLTNYHVISKAIKVFITLADGMRYEAEVVGSDPENDLAVLRFDPPGEELVTIPMGSSSDLKIGIKVLAIGNPFGLDRTLTTGIISGLGRPVRVSGDLVVHNMIQTDASINPGNSGGPLLDVRGDMVGINTSILSLSGGSVGIGFAIPIDTARRVVPDLIQYGIVRRGWIDIVPRQLFPQLVQYAGLPVTNGILISQLDTSSNADLAGLRGGDRSHGVRYGNTVIYLGGDIIVEVDGMEVRTIANLYEALEDTRPGDVVNLTYVRNGAQQMTTITLAERPQRFEWD